MALAPSAHAKRQAESSTWRRFPVATIFLPHYGVTQHYLSDCHTELHDYL